ncbi:hypothetical protein OEZ85_000023 [Tetradesmus obliquus]|uniref:Tc1-like transposase DDE domain-containing protein n=1 Tax=Tetradesmus obliquus TaxID=3088 RepID=A0ABY8USE3_TETOB|nr:hypothetical protein OEZ85_000023 [Tetradesmus obliquus]
MIRSRPAMQPLITLKSMKKRVSWSSVHKQANTDWQGVAALDSTYFTLHGSTPGGKFWHLNGQKPIRFRPNKSQQLHVYAAISAHGKTALHFASGTPGLKPQYSRITKQGQTVKLVGVGAQEFQELMWEKPVPETSPDLNPIENVWGIMKQQVYRQQYTKLEELKAAVLLAWAALPQSTLRNLMAGMHKRVEKVLRLRGGYIGH